MSKTKSKKTATILFVVCCSAVIIAACYKFFTELNPTFEDKPGSFMYTDFGVYVPIQYSIYGIDVSRYQERINWKQVDAMEVQNIQIDFAFIKATEGRTMKDKRFKQNWKEARENHIIRGAYHFYLPDGQPEVQAQNFIETVKLDSGDMPPVIDIEDRGIGLHKTFIKNIQVFLKKIETWCQCKPIVYSYDSFYEDYLKNELPGYPRWIARYGPEKPMNGEFDFWQFTDHAQVDGIGPKVDMNVFAGDSAAFYRLLLQ